MDDGAHEIDVVMNVGRLKSGDDRYVLRELRDVVEAADERPVKVILETCLLTARKGSGPAGWPSKLGRRLSKPQPVSARAAPPWMMFDSWWKP